MNLHEYQAKQLFRRYGIPVSEGLVVATPEAARQAAAQLGVPLVAKVQVHAGGRGKAGGIRVCSSAEDIAAFARQWLGQRLITPQTGAAGRPVDQILLERATDIRAEHYLALTIDRARATPVFVASASGGMAIEELAATRPRAVLTAPQPLDAALPEALIERLLAHLALPTSLRATGRRVLGGLRRLLTDCDASLVEINPLAETADGTLCAVDAKVTLDDNALFRHPELAAWRDPRQDSPIEVEAQRVGISYVGLEGNIGCLVNGAGLAMATNDILLLHGGRPANFLDVGGGANVEQVTRAFQLILQDARVRVILVNIFGGIMQCDVIAQGILDATRNMHLTVPLVVRLEGTRVEEGRQLLKERGGHLPLTSAPSFEEAAQLAVRLAAARA